MHARIVSPAYRIVSRSVSVVFVKAGEGDSDDSTRASASLANVTPCGFSRISARMTVQTQRHVGPN